MRRIRKRGPRAFCGGKGRGIIISSVVSFFTFLLLQGVDEKSAVQFYLGKRIAYIYKVRILKQARQAHIYMCGSSSSLSSSVYTNHSCIPLSQAKTLKNGSKYRSIWGKVVRAHGTNGVVRAKFRRNLPVSSRKIWGEWWGRVACLPLCEIAGLTMFSVLLITTTAKGFRRTCQGNVIPFQHLD